MPQPQRVSVNQWSILNEDGMRNAIQFAMLQFGSMQSGLSTKLWAT